ncbi:TetR/AcrR family transcriptional regulator [Nonomuraea rhizosphaerae]|uniref:TetR/AcrR family transcriptional regulator n=1 Tax=Nonomuraea rhizosphaerae TaxID=2665663 RepID=UPI001C5E6663|nr:TetR/AcrR family transcriptional regulator [Nonomuraea rhizosphaerae]
MGNREDLLAGARKCLAEKGWGRTTVRDISAASGGVSMAAIGYHFGSREALLNAALIQSIEEWGDRMEEVLSAHISPDATPAERFEATWGGIVESFTTHRALWLSSIEALLQAEHAPELRERLAAGNRDGRRGFAALVLGVPEGEIGSERDLRIGSAQLALFSGTMLQWLLDPEHAPTGKDVPAGVRELVAEIYGR